MLKVKGILNARFELRLSKDQLLSLRKFAAKNKISSGEVLRTFIDGGCCL